MLTSNWLVLFVSFICCGGLTPASGRTAIRNFRKGDANNSIDAHDGPIIQLEDPTNGNKLTFYRFAMAYTKCVLSGGETGTKFPRLRNFLRRGLNRFIEFATPNTHSGFDCAPIVTTWLSEGFGNDCGFKNPANGQSVLVHKSTDMENWIYVGDALADE